MQIVIIIVSILLITLVLLQSNKAEGASNIISGGGDLFAQRKERGGELFITRLTAILGIVFMVLCLIQGF